MSSMNAMWAALQNALGGHVPKVLGALAILGLGWILAAVVRGIIRKGLGFAGLNKRFTELTGQTLNLEKGVSVALFWVVLLLTLTAVFNSLNLEMVSKPFAALLTQLFEFVPRLLAGLVLALVAALLASVLRAVVKKALSKTTLDEKLSQHADMEPISDSLSHAAFWLIILLFVPAILGALQMDGLLNPLRAMVAKTLDIVPNAVAALLIGGVGWIVATVLRNLTANLLRTAGSDKFGQRSGLNESVKISRVVGLLVFLVVFLPALIAAFDALKIAAIAKPATDMLALMLAAVPRIIAAALILVVSWLVASFATGLLAKLLAAIGCDSLPRRVGLAQAFDKTSASVFIGRVALFFAMLFAAVEAANQLGFARAGDLIATFIRFGGDILLGSVILVVGFWLANLAYAGIDRASGPHTKGLARIGRIAILAVVLAIGLRAMGIADTIVNLAFGLTLGAVAVAVALSFGLGGREAAGKLMEHWLSKFRSDEH